MQGWKALCQSHDPLQWWLGVISLWIQAHQAPSESLAWEVEVLTLSRQSPLVPHTYCRGRPHYVQKVQNLGWRGRNRVTQVLFERVGSSQVRTALLPGCRGCTKGLTPGELIRMMRSQWHWRGTAPDLEQIRDRSTGYFRWCGVTPDWYYWQLNRMLAISDNTKRRTSFRTPRCSNMLKKCCPNIFRSHLLNNECQLWLACPRTCKVTDFKSLGSLKLPISLMGNIFIN